MSDSPARPKGIDPRGPRFAASVTTVLLAIAFFLSVVGISTARGSLSFVPGGVIVDAEGFALPATPLWMRIGDPGFLLTLVIALLFLWSVVSPRTAPWGVLYRRVVQPRLKPPTELEDPRPPRFAQGVGLFVTAIGLVLHLIGVPWALPIAVGMAFIAAFLNAVFGLCLGCQLYLLLQRAGLLGRARPAAA
jgi:hypothetical protein